MFLELLDASTPNVLINVVVVCPQFTKAAWTIQTSRDSFHINKHLLEALPKTGLQADCADHKQISHSIPKFLNRCRWLTGWDAQKETSGFPQAEGRSVGTE